MALQTWFNHTFTVYDPGATTWNAVPGIYIFASLINNGQTWIPLYIGMADSFQSRLSSHERWDEAVGKGARFVHAMVVENPILRELIEEQLIKHYQPELNVQLKGASLSALMQALAYPNPYFTLGSK